MFQNISNQYLSFVKQAADNTIKANTIAMEGFSSVVGLQLKTLENRMEVAAKFVSEVSEVRNLDAARHVFPKGMNIAKENMEVMLANGQEIFAIGEKTTQALSQIVKGQFEAANDAVVKNVSKATKR
jgi:Phasin protein